MISGKNKDGFFVATGSPGSWNDTCVAVKIEGDTIFVKDTKKENSPILEFNHEEWEVFIKGVKNNEFNL